MHSIKPKTALISLSDKSGLEELVKFLVSKEVKMLSTGGTFKAIKEITSEVVEVSDFTGFEEMMDGRVKTLHPKIHAGILARRDQDMEILQQRGYETIDLVVVNLYPFKETIAQDCSFDEAIEKIDIGGPTMIRSAAKNFKDVVCISTKNDYSNFLNILNKYNGETNLETRKKFASNAFNISSHYDTAIFNYFNNNNDVFKKSFVSGKELRYGENPHQKGTFYGDFDEMFNQLNGKELSYNNLLDVDSAVNLMSEFIDEKPTFAILKHNNACGLATRNSLSEAYKDALAGDPISAFGGVLISNNKIDIQTAEEINKLFCEVVIAPGFENSAIELLKSKKNRIILLAKDYSLKQDQ